MAFEARPDLAALNDKYKSAQQFSRAERDLWLPTVSAIAAAGGTPVRADQIHIVLVRRCRSQRRYSNL